MRRRNRILSDILNVVIISLIISFVALYFIIMPCQVHGKSMETTLYDNDIGYSFKINKFFAIRRFDICVIKTKTDEDDEKLLVKRIIGMPNEKVEYKDNKLYINGIYIEEEYLKDVYTEDFVVQLLSDEYFCLGDNRDVSRDSRYYGPFTKDEIVATGMIVIYPFKDFGVKK